MELNRAMTLPAGSRTGPVLIARDPEARTSTWSSSQENGAVGSLKNAANFSMTLAFPVKRGFTE